MTSVGEDAIIPKSPADGDSARVGEGGKIKKDSRGHGAKIGESASGISKGRGRGHGTEVREDAIIAQARARKNRGCS